MNEYTADFETTTDENDCRVWAWGVCNIEDLDFQYGNDISSFIGFLYNSCKYKNSTVWFHNLKFDGEFLFNHILRTGWTHITDSKDAREKTFETLISSDGVFYSIKLYFYVRGRRKKFVTILNSLNVLPFSVKAIAKSFGLPIQKGEIDYDEYREVGHKLTEIELTYLKNDVEICARALQYLFSQEQTKMTQASNALNFYKKMMGKKFEKWFPKLSPLEDYEIRQSYKGGWTYCDDRTANQEIGEGLVYDVNSLYPSVMSCVHGEMLPYGKPERFEGEYVYDKDYPLYTIMFSCVFEIKENHLPTIQIKGGRFAENEYLKSSNNELVTMCLTSVDFKLFQDHYNITELEFHGGYKFKAGNTMFVEYVDHWTEQKISAKKDGNKGMYLLSKLMLNALYGKFATSLTAQSKAPYLKSDGSVGYHLLEEVEKDGLYIPMGTFITSYARDFTIRSAQSVYDRFMYADTDSIHIKGLEVPNGLEIDSYKLGAWDNELVFSKAKYLRQKCYMEYGKEPNSDGEEYWKLTCCGMPENVKETVTFEDFNFGLERDGKLMPKHVAGGIVLVNKTFTLKPPKIDKNKKFNKNVDKSGLFMLK